MMVAAWKSRSPMLTNRIFFSNDFVDYNGGRIYWRRIEHALVGSDAEISRAIAALHPGWLKCVEFLYYDEGVKLQEKADLEFVLEKIR